MEAGDSKSVYKWMKLFLILAISFVSSSEAFEVPITYVTTAVAKGAVCMDGSPPAYHFDKGFGSGINNWLIHVEGGAWCESEAACLAKRNTRLGSSSKMTTKYTFSGILANQAKYNPDFYNWNRVKVRYCDGSSFTGDVEAVDPKTKIYYRGARVWRAIMDELMEKGMSNAKTALLSGCSAGGLTAILHCDSFSDMLPSANVKCFSDAGYFINGKDVSGGTHIQQLFSQVVSTHGSAKNLPSSCTSKYSPSLCFFPQYASQGTRTPLFLLNAAYDSWQVKNILAPGIADHNGVLRTCKLDITKCSSSQLEILEGFRKEFLDALAMGGKPSSRGMFINSCYCHCQSGMQETWLRGDSPVVGGTQIWKAVGDWFFERNVVQRVEECSYPCDKTCHNRAFEDSLHCPGQLSDEDFHSDLGLSSLACASASYPQIAPSPSPIARDDASYPQIAPSPYSLASGNASYPHIAPSPSSLASASYCPVSLGVSFVFLLAFTRVCL